MADRGVVHYTEPADVKAGDEIYASSTSYLLDVLLTVMNERDSWNKIKANPTTMGLKQLSGIADAGKESEMRNTKGAIVTDAPVYASWINTIIKYTNEMTSTVGNTYTKMESRPCQFPVSKTLIQKQEQKTVPDMQEVDPVTGIGVFNADGTPKMIPGYKNPVPVLDAGGNPTYYTVTKKQIFKEGPITNTDTTGTYNVCSNPTIECSNRVKLYGWSDMESATDPGYVYECTNTNRVQAVEYSNGTGAGSIASVAAGQKIMASTFIAITTNLRQISHAIDAYGPWNNGACALTCQVTCQQPCQLSCQSCYGGTCHNQNCGGFS